MLDQGGWSQEMRRTGGTGSKAASDIHSAVNLCCALLGLQDLVIHPVPSQREKQNIDKFMDFNRISGYNLFLYLICQ